MSLLVNSFGISGIKHCNISLLRVKMSVQEEWMEKWKPGNFRVAFCLFLIVAVTETKTGRWKRQARSKEKKIRS